MRTSLVGIGFLAISCCLTGNDLRQDASDVDQIGWTTTAAMVQRINDLPLWTDSDFTAEEWLAYVNVAKKMKQKTHVENEVAILAFAVGTLSSPHGPLDAEDAERIERKALSKVMLLNRLLFEIDPDESVQLMRQGIRSAGYIHCNFDPQIEERRGRMDVTVPVRVDACLPTLVAAPDWRKTGRRLRRPIYEPHQEYAVFAKHYRFRDFDCIEQELIRQTRAENFEDN